MSSPTPRQKLSPRSATFGFPRPRCPIATATAAATITIIAVLSLARPAAAQLVPGDILIDNGNTIQRYGTTGTTVTLKTTYSTSGTTNYKGASITPDGNIATTYSGTANFKGGIVIYKPGGGTALKKFSTTAVKFPGDVSVFADGTLAINDQYGSVREYSQSGSLIRSISVSTDINSDLFGNTVAPDNTLFVVDSGLNTIYHFNEAGTLLGSFVTSFGPNDLVVSPLDGTLFISASGGDVYHTTTTGTVLGSFASGVSGDFDGIGISGDGSAIFAAGYTSTTIRKLDSTTGSLLNSFPISSPGNVLFMTVVPNSSAAAPEPGSMAFLALGGLPVVGAIARRRYKAA